MAYRNYRRSGKGKGKFKSRRTNLEKLAYSFGQINRGLKNPNSRVYESYANGLTGKTTTNKKPLI